MRLIDADKIQFSEIDEIGGEYEPYLGCSKEQIDNAPTVEAIPKADYETRLKADMVAILEDLDLQIDESAAYNLEVAKVQRLIRDRIDKLKENKE